jgi:hypothetical protein
LPAPLAGSACNGAETTGTDLEREVAGAWRKALGADHVGLDDNFFDIGGNSLLLVSVHARLQTMLNRRIPVAELFAHTTVRALSERLGGSVPDSGSWRAAQNQAQKQRAAFARARERKQAVL